MPKKRTTKKAASRKLTATKRSTPKKIEDKLLENLIELQKVHTNLAQKFDKLSDQIAGLLGLFEMAARSFANQPHIKTANRDKEFLEKIDTLLDQNKTLAKGLTLMEQKMREKIYGPISSPNRQRPRPAPRY